MAPDPKPNRLKARLPRGLADRAPAEIAATRRMIDQIREVYERYGFEPVETPTIEYTDALGKFLPDQDRPNEGVFSFKDDDEQWLSLRYDLTAPLARYVAENFDALPKPYRSYRYGWVFRNEKPGPGRYRQFMQFDADTVGSAAMAADAEMCMMAADTMEALGIPRGSYVVKVWNRKLLEGILDAIALRDGMRRLTVLRAIDKLDRLGFHGVQQLLGGGRKDESGDFTRGAALPTAANNFVTSTSSTAWSSSISEGYSSQDLFAPPIIEELTKGKNQPFDFAVYRQKLRAYLHDEPIPEASEAGLGELEEIRKIIDSAGYSDRIRIDPTVVRGLEYYTGPVYEVELTFETKDEHDRPVRFGSVGGGGRYDGLVGRFRGEDVPATGFSIGVSRLQAALHALGKIDGQGEPGPVVVTVFDRDRIADYQRMVQRLREAGIRAELYLGQGKMGSQFKYADKRGAPCVVIQGGDEKAKNEVQIKDLVLGAEIAGLSKDHEDYRRKQAEAQFACKEDELLEAVQKVLAKHTTEASLFASLVGKDVFDLLFEVAPLKVAARVSKALDHFNKATRLKGVDDEMGAIRLIAAEEELVVAIFEFLKLNAERLPQHRDFVRKYKSHKVKLAFHPVLSQFRWILSDMLSTGMALDGLEEYGIWNARPVVLEKKVRLEIVDPQGKVLFTHDPLASALSRDDMSDQEIVDELFADFAKIVRTQLNMSIPEFISERAEFRNHLLYASDMGYRTMEENLNSLIETFKETFRDLLWALAILLGNTPPKKTWGLVSQFIALYRRTLAECELV